MLAVAAISAKTGQLPEIVIGRVVDKKQSFIVYSSTLVIEALISILPVSDVHPVNIPGKAVTFFGILETPVRDEIAEKA